MERVSEVLQLPVVVHWSRAPALEIEPPEKRDFLLARRAAECGILQKLPEPRLFHEDLSSLAFDKPESLNVSGDHSRIQNDVQSERREVDVPGFDQRIQERDAVLRGQVEDVRIEELEHDHAHLL